MHEAYKEFTGSDVAKNRKCPRATYGLRSGSSWQEENIIIQFLMPTDFFARYASSYKKRLHSRAFKTFHFTFAAFDHERSAATVTSKMLRNIWI